VAELAAAWGGVLLVDATRSATKRFPDALSKTVPIWCAVINAAVAAAAGAGDASGGVALPPWVPPSEACAIDARLPGWVASLQQVLGPHGLAPLPALAAKPLRCLWLSQDTPLWGLPRPEELPFTPVLCVSASAPLCGSGQRHSDGSGQGTSFSYVPGAGDDQESWSRGLTAPAFWAHRDQLLAAADEELRCAVDALVTQQHPAVPGGAPAADRSALRAAPPALRARPTGGHDLPPRGVPASPAAPAGEGVETGRLLWLGATGLGVASFDALHLRGPALWRDTQAAVLLCDGDAAAAEGEAHQLLGPVPPGALLCVHVSRAQGDRARGSLVTALAQCIPFVQAVLGRGASVLVACPDGCERAPAALTALLAVRFKEPPAGGGDADPHASDGDMGGEGLASKLLVRRWLAFVCKHHTEARPTRALLKQAYAALRAYDERRTGD
jgi:tRNA A64-2'-O-ribosylphosphate transferase